MGEDEVAETAHEAYKRGIREGMDAYRFSLEDLAIKRARVKELEAGVEAAIKALGPHPHGFVLRGLLGTALPGASRG